MLERESILEVVESAVKVLRERASGERTDIAENGEEIYDPHHDDRRL